MSVTVTCQYTGIEFEAASKRSKNHPAVSRLLTEASNDKHNPNRYRLTVNAFAEARKAGLTDIDEIMTFVNEVVTNGVEAAYRQRKAAAEQQRAQDEARKEAQQRRRDRNALLYRHGYRWIKESEEDRDFHAGFMTDPLIDQWQLIAADGRTVTVQQALEEIRNA